MWGAYPKYPNIDSYNGFQRAILKDRLVSHVEGDKRDFDVVVSQPHKGTNGLRERPADRKLTARVSFVVDSTLIQRTGRTGDRSDSIREQVHRLIEQVD